MRARLWSILVLACAGCGGAPPADARPHDDPELVVLDGDVGNAYVLAGEPSEVITRLRVSTRAIEGAARPPINLALVVDTSGSMMGEPIDDARDASLALLDALRPEDRLSVVAFHSETEVLLPSTPLTGADLGALRAQIGRMEARGTTDLAGGLRAGLEQLIARFEPRGINRLVLLSDGVPNDPSSILALAQAAGERGIRITALGLGLEYDETLLGQIAQVSNGRFHYVEESARVAEVFRDEVLRFERLLARDMMLELRPGPGVSIEGVVGQPVATSGGGVQIALGDLSEGEERDVIVRLRAQPRRAGATLELMDAVLRFQDAVVDAGSLERRIFVGARATDVPAEVEGGRNADVEGTAMRMMAAVTTVEAIARAREGEVTAARQLLDQAAARAAAVAEQSNDAALRLQVSEMRVLGEALPTVSARSDSPTAEAAEPASVIRRSHDRAMGVLQGSR